MVEVDNLVLADNTVVQVNDVQKHRAYHFLATGEILGPRQLKIDAMNEKRRKRQHEVLNMVSF